MKRELICFIILISSLQVKSQQDWAGTWEIPMLFQKNFPDKKKADYWCRFYIRRSKDSVGLYTWKSDVHHGKPIWSFTGSANSGADSLYMYASNYVDHRPKKEKQVNEENNPGKPFYVLYRDGKRYMLLRLQGKTEPAVEIKKMK